MNRDPLNRGMLPGDAAREWCNGVLAAGSGPGSPGLLPEQELLVAQLLDGVAEAGGPLELELAGRRAHVGFQADNMSVKVGLGAEFRQSRRLFLGHVAVLGLQK